MCLCLNNAVLCRNDFTKLVLCRVSDLLIILKRYLAVRFIIGLVFGLGFLMSDSAIAVKYPGENLLISAPSKNISENKFHSVSVTYYFSTITDEKDDCACHTKVCQFQIALDIHPEVQVPDELKAVWCRAVPPFLSSIYRTHLAKPPKHGII